MEYFVVRDYFIEELEKEVNRRLSLGWKLQGGVTIKDDRSLMYYQAMIIKD